MFTSRPWHFLSLDGLTPDAFVRRTIIGGAIFLFPSPKPRTFP